MTNIDRALLTAAGMVAMAGSTKPAASKTESDSLALSAHNMTSLELSVDQTIPELEALGRARAVSNFSISRGDFEGIVELLGEASNLAVDKFAGREVLGAGLKDSPARFLFVTNVVDGQISDVGPGIRIAQAGSVYGFFDNEINLTFDKVTTTLLIGKDLGSGSVELFSQLKSPFGETPSCYAELQYARALNSIIPGVTRASVLGWLPDTSTVILRVETGFEGSGHLLVGISSGAMHPF